MPPPAPRTATLVLRAAEVEKRQDWRVRVRAAARANIIAVVVGVVVEGEKSEVKCSSATFDFSRTIGNCRSPFGTTAPSLSTVHGQCMYLQCYFFKFNVQVQPTQGNVL